MALPLVVLALLFLVGFVAIPFGLPGLWVIVLAVIVYGWWTGFHAVGLVTISLALGLALVGEVLEWRLGFRYARKYGGSRRAGWGALIGGMAGAVIGVPVPVIGSVIGAFVGAFGGAAVAEFTRARNVRGSASAGWGAVLGRIAGATVKVGLGLVIAVVTAFAIVHGR